MDLHVSAPVLEILVRRHARRHPGSPSGLEEVLVAKGYPVRENVLAFDAAFGGLTFPETDAGPTWSLTEDRGWMIGAELCLREGGHDAPRGGEPEAEWELVPVAYSPNDVIFYLDREGRAWVEDTIEGEPHPCAEDGLRLVTTLVLQTLLWQSQRPVTHEGAKGEALARELGLAPIDDASDTFQRWWWGPSHYLVEVAATDEEEPRTLVVTR